MNIREKEYEFDSFLEVMEYFKRSINVYKQMNYCELKSESVQKYRSELDGIIDKRMK